MSLHLEGTNTHLCEATSQSPQTSVPSDTQSGLSKKRKFDRSNWKTEERSILQEHLVSVGTYPTSEMLKTLAQVLKTSTRRVQVWFQNQRQRGTIVKCQQSKRYDMDYALVAKVLQDFTGKTDAECMAEARAMLQGMGQALGDEMVEFALFHGCNHRTTSDALPDENVKIMDDLFMESIALNKRLDL